MKILIISAGRYPVPATKGGAVSTLINSLALNNEASEKIALEITSPFDHKAVELAKEFKNCRFIFIKTPSILLHLESLIYYVCNKLLPTKNWIQIKSIFSFIWFVWKNAIILKKNQYDYVVIENTARLFLCFKIFGNQRKFKDKIIYHLHNEPHKFGGCRKNIIKSKYIFCISEYIKHCITKKGSPLSLIDSSKACILKNCIDTSKFFPFSFDEKNRMKKNYGFTEDDKIVIFSGRIDSEKGIREVLLAMKQIKTSNVKLLIVGSSFYGMKVSTRFEEEIVELANELGKQVVYTGFIPYEEMPKAYNVADIAVLPSMWEEPAGLTVIEAMACGTPVITTYSGGIPEYVDEKCVVLLNRDNNIVRNISLYIDKLLSDENLRSEMAKESSCLVQTLYDSKNYLDTFLSLL